VKFSRKILAFVLVAGLSLQSVNVFAGPASTSRKVKTESEITELTVEEATQKAIRNNTSLKNAMDDETLSDDNIRKAIDAMHDARTDQTLTAANVSLMNAELGRALNLKDIESQKQNVAYQISKYFNTILNAQRDVALYDESLTIAKKELDIAKLKLDLGMISQLDYDTAALNYEQIESARLTKINAIDSSYRDLNKYMGVSPLDKQYTLKLELEYKPVGNININSHAENFVKNSLTVQQIENTVKTATYTAENYVDPYNPATGEILDSTTTKEQLTVAQNKALRSLEDTKTSVYESVVSAYSSLKDSEINIKAAEIELEKAQKQLAATEKMLELGQVTQLDVDKLKYDINSKQLTVQKAKNAYALALEAFSNPNLLTSFSSGGYGSLGGAGGTGM